jgi:hypothetical protein
VARIIWPGTPLLRKFEAETNLCAWREVFVDEIGLGWKTNTEWFSALDITKPKKSSKDQHKCLPISKKRQKSSKTFKRFATN